jgi:hypothetical protein
MSVKVMRFSLLILSSHALLASAGGDTVYTESIESHASLQAGFEKCVGLVRPLENSKKSFSTHAFAICFRRP